MRNFAHSESSFLIKPALNKIDDKLGNALAEFDNTRAYYTKRTHLHLLSRSFADLESSKTGCERLEITQKSVYVPICGKIKMLFWP